MPALIASLAIGALAGPHGPTAHITPQPALIVQELQTNHDLPKGTKLTLGDPKRPLTVCYDIKGRLLFTPPKGQTFGTILSRGFLSLGTIARRSGARLAQAGTIVATAQTVTRQ